MNSSLNELESILLAELGEAQRSREKGNEGRARVCARRAAGWATGWYVENKTQTSSHDNALEHLKWLAEQTEASDEIKQAATRLTTRVDVDGRHPFHQDPIQDAVFIIRELLGLPITLT